MFGTSRLASFLFSLATVFASTGIGFAQCPSWRTFAPSGLNGTGSALVVFDDGSGSALYVGGAFDHAGHVAANNIARWDGSNWSPVGSGTNGAVLTLCVFDDGSGPALYAGGEFTVAGGVGANHIAKWNGSSWSPLGHGLRRGNTVGEIYVAALSLLVFDDGTGPALFAGGYFLAAGDVPASRIAKWDGSTWSALGVGIQSGIVFAMTLFDDGTGPALYASGGGGNSVGKWNGSVWSSLGSGPNSTVTALTVYDDGSGPALFAGGLFDHAGGVLAVKIAKWNGTNWSALAGAGPTDGGAVLTFAVFDDGSGSALYVGGDFWKLQGIPNSGNVARWNGASWSMLGAGIDRVVNAFAVFDAGTGPKLYIDGDFTVTGGTHLDRIASWSGTSWLPLGGDQSFDLFVYTLTTFDDGSGSALYAGGRFTHAGATVVNGVARWNGSAWSALGSGMDLEVESLVVFDDGSGPALYAGGRFSTAGGMAAHSIAKWDGSSWSPVGGGTNTDIYMLAVFDDGSGPALYAGGQFTTAGGVPANYVAKWNGSTWAPLGTGLGGSLGGGPTFVGSMCVYDDGTGPALFVGGDFTSAGGVSVSEIARWNGSTWAALGSGLAGGFSSAVRAMCVYDEGAGPALFVGGDFSIAGGVNASYIARWNGSTWSALVSGVGGRVSALTVFDDGFGAALYAGGGFSSAGGASANNVAKWQGSLWSPLGQGVSNLVLALCVFDDHTGAAPGLWTGGEFSQAGGYASYFIAEWTGCDITPGPFCSGDGSGSACPCGNNGSAGNGCANSVASAGANLAGMGLAHVAADSFVLMGSGMPNSLVLYFQGAVQVNGGLGVPFGDGLKCAGGHVIRLGAKMNASGASSYPESGDASISIRGMIPAAGGSRSYQAWYRDVPGVCGSGFNFSNGLQVTWSP